MVIAITGANGFVGGHIADYLEHTKHLKIKRITRVDTGDLVSPTIKTDWLDGVDIIVHTAAALYAKRWPNDTEPSDTEIERIQRINSDGAANIAKAASAKGVKRFIFISCAHVYGRSANGALTEDAELLPTNLHAACKMDAERRLIELIETHGMEVIILRPPLIYGPLVKANFRAMIKLADLGVPLPFSALVEQRSYCYVYNLADAIFKCALNEHCWNEVYNIADGQPLSIHQLSQNISRALGRQPVSFYLPKWLMKALLVMLGKRHIIEALCKPLVLDTTSIQQALSWQPPFTTGQGLTEMIKWYKEHKK